jgi:hypothetical protein
MRLENDFSEPDPPDTGTMDRITGTIDRITGTACRPSYYDPVNNPSDANALAKHRRAKAPCNTQAGRAAATDDPWIGRVQAFRERGFWLPDWGPPPGSAHGCRVPPQVLQRFGYG